MRTFEQARKQGSCYIIAEAGVNHNGNLDLAFQLVDAAIEAGADCVKFQTWLTEDDIIPDTQTAAYQQANSNENSQYNLLKKLELPFSDFVKIKKYCDAKNIQFISTAFELKSFEFLLSLGMPFWKIPSSDVDHYPLIEKMAKSGLPIIMSSGMSDMQELEKIVKLFRSWRVQDLTVLHCNTEYPTPFEDVNLLAMRYIAEQFECAMGYSDHTLGISVPIAAVALGATVIEKHFTLDRNMEGPDHAASIEPAELKQMVQSIREVEAALGTKEKILSNSAKQNIIAARKSIYAIKEIKPGDEFSSENIACKRPGGGINALEWPNLIGKKSENKYIRHQEIDAIELRKKG